LTMFRQFRDSWLIKQSDGDSIILEYYHSAPRIVENINRLSNSFQIYYKIWNDWLKECLGLIENKEYEKCKTIYIRMVKYLQRKYC
jgi:hypothetical protein